MSHMSMGMSSSQTSTPFLHGQSPASLLFSHHNGNGHHSSSFAAQTPPTPSLLSAFAANTLLSTRRLRLIASMFSQMCEAVSVCHDAGVAHRDIKPENFICCDSVELEVVAEGQEDEGGFGPQAKRKVVVKLTDFGLATTEEDSGDVECGSKPYMSYGAYPSFM
jgi:serine/threonine protein kinase